MRTEKTSWFIVTLATLLLSGKLFGGEFERHLNLEYVEGGDSRQVADVYVPEGDGPFPAVLLVHGGAWYTGTKWNMSGHARSLATDGYSVVNVNYRLAPKHKFPAQIDDCRAALGWMNRNAAKYKIDTKRISGYGYSAGAHLVTLLGMSHGTQLSTGEEDAGVRLQAIIAGGTPCNFMQISEDRKSLAYFLGGTRRDKPDVYRKASPASFVTKDDPPIFFFHGDKDRLVPRKDVDEMIVLLKDAGVKHELHVIPEKGHIAAFLDRDAKTAALRFLNRTFKKDQAAAE